MTKINKEFNNRISLLEAAVAKINKSDNTDKIEKLTAAIESTLAITKSSNALVSSHIAQLDGDKHEYYIELRDFIFKTTGIEGLPNPTPNKTKVYSEDVAVGKVPSATRTGTIQPNESGNKSRRLTKYLMDRLDELGYRVAFDVATNDRGLLSAMEFCGTLGGCTIQYSEPDVVKEVLYRAIELEHDPVDYAKKIRENPTVDKYKLRPAFSRAKSMVFLPGSNLMDTAVDFNRVTTAIESGADIKPHPLTNHNDVIALRDKYPGKVLGAKSSASALIPNMDKMYVTDSTELSFVGIANGVEIIDITKINTKSPLVGSYHSVLSVIQSVDMDERINAMNSIFSSQMSGIFFSEEDIDNNLMNFINEVEGIIGVSLLDTK